MVSALDPRTIIRGNPVSSLHQVEPIELVRWMVAIADQVAANGTYWTSTLAALTAYTPDDGAIGFVTADGTASNNGVYRRESSAWNKTAELPSGWSGVLGTAAEEDTTYFATAGQGALADSAVQPGDLQTAQDRAQLLDPSRTEVREAWTSDLTGEPEDRTEIAIGTVTNVTGNGGILVISGGDYSVSTDVAPRRVFRVEDRIYRVRVSMQRIVDPSDPSGHAVELRMQNLTAAKASVSNVVLNLFDGLDVLAASGVVTYEMTIGRSGSGADYEVPATCIYVVPFLRIYGDDHELGIEYVEFDAATATAAQGALADSAVQPARTVTAGTGLTGGGDLSADRTLALDAATQTSLGKADSAVQPARTVTAGTGLTGGGDLSADRTLALDAATQTSLGKADSAVQPDTLAIETAARASGDASNSSAISAEASARKAADTDRVRAPGLAVYKVPAIGGNAALTFRSDGGGVVDRKFSLASGVQNVFLLPAIGGYGKLTYRADGVGITDATAAIAARSGLYNIPSVGGSRAMSINGDGVYSIHYDDIAGAVGTEQPTQRVSYNAAEGYALPQVWLQPHAGACLALTDGPYGAELIDFDVPAGTATVLRKGRKDIAKWRRTRLGDTYQTGTRKLYLVIVWGQSLAQGHIDNNRDYMPAWRGNGPELARMFDGSAVDGLGRGPRPAQYDPIATNKGEVVADGQFARLVRLHEDTHGMNGRHGMTVCTPAALALHGGHLECEEQTIWCVIGTGSTEIASFKSGEAHYTSMVKAITAACERVSSLNGLSNTRDYELSVFSVQLQGEQDNADGTPAATYKSDLQSIVSALSASVTSEATAAGITASYDGHVILQTMQGDSVEVGMATRAQADLIRSEGDIHGVAMYPMLPGAAATHLYPGTYMPAGAGLAYVISEIIDGNSPTPFVADGGAVLDSATQTTITISGGSGVFDFDTATIPNSTDGNYGITMRDDMGAVTVESVAKSGANTFVVTHASTDIGDSPIVEIGIKGNSQLPFRTAPRVNIRDDSAWPCPMTGQVVSGWVISHEVNITAA